MPAKDGPCVLITTTHAQQKDRNHPHIVEQKVTRLWQPYEPETIAFRCWELRGERLDPTFVRYGTITQLLRKNDQYTLRGEIRQQLERFLGRGKSSDRR